MTTTTWSQAAADHNGVLLEQCMDTRVAKLGPPPEGKVVGYTTFHGEVIAEVGTITQTTETSVDAAGSVVRSGVASVEPSVDYHTGILVASCPGGDDAGAGAISLDPASIRPKW